MPDTREIELKLALLPSDAERVRRTGLGRVATPAGTTSLRATYYDTPDGRLRGQGLSLRIRQEGDRWIQTAKGPAAGVGLFDRDEWEAELAGDALDLEALGRTPFAAALGSKRVRRALVPLFTVETERSLWLISDERYAVEVTLDIGSVSADGRSLDLAEIEIELKRGAPADLFDVARVLDRSCPLRLGTETKAARGYRLRAGGGSGRAVKASAVSLDPEMTAGDAFAAIAWSCIEHFRANEAGATGGRDAASLHQARVALRRLRAALSLFRPVVADRRLPGVRSHLGKVAATLGEARDLDVFLAHLAAGGPVPGVEPGRRDAFAAHAGARREAAYDAVAAALNARRFRSFMLDLAAWIAGGPWRSDLALAPERDAPVTAFAAEALRRRRRKVRRGGRDLAGLSATERHRVRIDGKKLRYAAEFFAGLAEGGKARRRRDALLAAASDLQEELGALNDAEARIGLTRLLLSDFPDAAGPADGEDQADDEALSGRLARAQAAQEIVAEVKRFLR